MERGLLRLRAVPFDWVHGDDDAFDAMFPARMRLVSPRFWTPIAVASQAARLLRGAGATHVLDVGAGVGKFVLAAAAAAPELQFVGIEHRRHLVTVARRIRARLQIPNARFQAGNAIATRWPQFDAFYFFNPLAENLLPRQDRIDDEVELSDAKFVRDVLAIEAKLRDACCGTVVVTYHGPSVRVPGCYRLEQAERAGSDWLRLWVKRDATDDGAFFVEAGDAIERCPPIGRDSREGPR